MQLLYFRQVVCMHSSRESCIGSGGAMCAGGLFVLFGLWFGGLSSLLAHSLSQMCRVVALGPGLVFFR
jgi:hypothetical protein